MTQTHHRSIPVTGGAGYIGSHTILQLLKQGFHVVVVDTLIPRVHRRGKLLLPRPCLLPALPPPPPRALPGPDPPPRGLLLLLLLLLPGWMTVAATCFGTLAARYPCSHPASTPRLLREPPGPIPPRRSKMYLQCYINEKGDKVYTTKKESPLGVPTQSAHPARFSPDDKFSRQRYLLKKRFGLLPTQQPAPKY